LYNAHRISEVLELAKHPLINVHDIRERGRNVIRRWSESGDYPYSLRLKTEHAVRSGIKRSQMRTNQVVTKQ